MYLQFQSVKEPSKNNNIRVRVLFGSWKTWVLVQFVLAGFGFFPISKSNRRLICVLYRCARGSRKKEAGGKSGWENRLPRQHPTRWE